MSMDAAAFKEEVMQLITTFMSSFDPSGRSTELWKQKLGSLPDKEFVKEVKAILDNPKRWFSPEIAPFDKKHNLHLTHILSWLKCLVLNLRNMWFYHI